MNPNLTKKQRAILEYISDFIDNNGYPPAVRDICKGLGYSSTATVFGYIERLREKGYLDKDDSKNRGLRLLKNGETKKTVNIPIVGNVAAGQPILAYENIEGYFPLSENLYSNDETFILRVKGESMINAGIYDGDLIIIKKQSTAENGDKVVALIDDEATVKTFYKEKGHYRLQPENDFMDPIIVDHVIILGIVAGLFRKY